MGWMRKPENMEKNHFSTKRAGTTPQIGCFYKMNICRGLDPTQNVVEIPRGVVYACYEA